ncbi:MAG: pentapeptide repeat-containing protein [Thermodesulfobacteriota bacterium]|nr:pentapeptide repeat-containing protein [Thermodesulfobacteriota bacterium]
MQTLGAVIEESDLSMIRAMGANFSDSLLNHSTLENALCRRTDFTGAAIGNVKAREADFSDGVFNNADLCAAVFVKSNCTGASFKKADCHGARFAKATLENADWQGAVMIGVTAPDVASLATGIQPLPLEPIPYLQIGQTAPVNSAVLSP